MRSHAVLRVSVAFVAAAYTQAYGGMVDGLFREIDPSL